MTVYLNETMINVYYSFRCGLIFGALPMHFNWCLHRIMFGLSLLYRENNIWIVMPPPCFIAVIQFANIFRINKAKNWISLCSLRNTNFPQSTTIPLYTKTSLEVPNQNYQMLVRFIESAVFSYFI